MYLTDFIFCILSSVDAAWLTTRCWWTSATTWRKTCTQKPMLPTCRGKRLPRKRGEEMKVASFINMLYIPYKNLHSKKWSQKTDWTFLQKNLGLIWAIIFANDSVTFKKKCRMSFWESVPKHHLEHETSKLKWMQKKLNNMQGCSSLGRTACCAFILLKWNNWFSPFWKLYFPPLCIWRQKQ